MARRVVIRSGKLNTAIRQLEDQLANEWKKISEEHREELAMVAEWIVDDARELVPLMYGKLRDSIGSRVSRSYRYPGIHVWATAKSGGYDYALIQEENEEFEHAPGRQAHYLSEPFFNLIGDYFFEMTGKNLVLPEASYGEYTKGVY